MAMASCPPAVHHDEPPHPKPEGRDQGIARGARTFQAFASLPASSRVVPSRTRYLSSDRRGGETRLLKNEGQKRRGCARSRTWCTRAVARLQRQCLRYIRPGQRHRAGKW